LTICVAVKVAEGMIMAADSAVTLEGWTQTPQGAQSGVIQTFLSRIPQMRAYC
jgi:hypothetical protein